MGNWALQPTAFSLRNNNGKTEGTVLVNTILIVI